MTEIHVFMKQLNAGMKGYKDTQEEIALRRIKISNYNETLEIIRKEISILRDEIEELEKL